MPKYINADELEQNLKTAIAMMEMTMSALDAEDDEGLQMELKAYRDILEGVQWMYGMFAPENETKGLLDSEG